MDEKYKRSYRWRLTAMIMLFLLVLAVIFIAIFALPNDEGQPTTETNKTISGSVNFTGATDNTFYIKEVRLQEGDGEAEVLSITPGYINNGFAFTEIGEVSSDDIKLYFDIINATTQPFTVSASWTGTDDGTIYYLHETTVPAGTGEEITADTPATATLTLDVTFGSSTSLDLSDVTIDIAQQYNYSDFEFQLNGNMTATLTAYNGAGGYVAIPDTFSVIDNGDGTQSYVEGDQYTVTAIADGDFGSGVFSNRDDIINVIFPESLTNIGANAFSRCSGLTSITFPECLTSIGYYAFYDCTGLTTLDLSGCTSLTSIYDNAFMGCTGLISIKLPNGIEYVGRSVFANCHALQTQTDDYGVEYIGNDENPYLVLIDGYRLTTDTYAVNSNCRVIGAFAFSNRTNLTSITLPSSLRFINNSAFWVCRNLETLEYKGTLEQYLSIEMDYSWMTDGSHSLRLDMDGDGETEEVTSIVVPSSISEIPNCAFYGCTSLTSIVLPETLTSIESSAFEGCTSLTSITLPEALTSIGSHAFSDCTNLETLEFKGTLEQYLSMEISNDWITDTSLSLRLYIDIDGDGETEEVTSLVVPEGITEIKDYTFQNYRGLTNVTLPESLTSIGDWAFSQCYNLTTVDLSTSTSLTSIGSSAFYGCASLTTIDLSGCTNLTSIGSYAFQNCASIETLDLSRCTNLISIEYSAFRNCTSFTSINLPNSIEYVGQYAFNGCNALQIQTDDYGVEYIGNDENPYLVLVDAGGLTTDTYIVNSNCKVIGAYAFNELTTLTNITLSSSLAFINNNAFYYCTSLTILDLNDCINLTSIGSSAFFRCSGLTSIILNQYLFENATSGTACGNLLQNITSGETVYVPANLIDELHLTNSYLDGDTFTRSETAVDGYYIYTKI